MIIAVCSSAYSANAFVSQLSEEYRKLNTLGQVPTLVIDGVTLFQSVSTSLIFVTVDHFLVIILEWTRLVRVFQSISQLHFLVTSWEGQAVEWIIWPWWYLCCAVHALLSLYSVVVMGRSWCCGKAWTHQFSITPCHLLSAAHLGIPGGNPAITCPIAFRCNQESSSLYPSAYPYFKTFPYVFLVIKQIWILPTMQKCVISKGTIHGDMCHGWSISSHFKVFLK